MWSPSESKSQKLIQWHNTSLEKFLALLQFSRTVGIQWAVLPAGFENLEKNLPICELKPGIIL